MTVRAKLQRPQHRPLTYTFVPPSQGATRPELDAVAETLRRVLAMAPIDAVHVPAVRPDPRSPRRPFVPKLAPRAFAQAMNARLPEPPEWLIDRGVVDSHWAHQEIWLRRTLDETGFSSLLLVGGASRQIRYPGESVLEAARRIRAAYGDRVGLAGIVIPTRANELERVVAKTEAGLDLFVTQILGEARSTMALLMDYHDACRERGLRPRPIVASVAPVGGRQDVEFLESWGVRFDPRWRRELLRSAVGAGWRSMDIAVDLVHRLRDVVDRDALEVPLGVNVEHVRPRNVELSAELLERLTSE